LGDEEEENEIRQVEEGVVQHRTPDAVGLPVEPALGEAEEEERDERCIRPGLRDVVRGGEKRRRASCECPPRPVTGLEPLVQEPFRQPDERSPEKQLFKAGKQKYDLQTKKGESPVPAGVASDDVDVRLIWELNAEQLGDLLRQKAKADGNKGYKRPDLERKGQIV